MEAEIIVNANVLVVSEGGHQTIGILSRGVGKAKVARVIGQGQGVNVRGVGCDVGREI